MELFSKLADSASMFWQSLDERERFMVLYLGAVMVVGALASSQRKREEKLIARLRQEINNG